MTIVRTGKTLTGEVGGAYAENTNLAGTFARTGQSANIECPHCGHSFTPGDLLWVSRHDDLIGDPVLGPQAHSRFRPSRFTAGGEAIDARDEPCQLLACPFCHLVVPRLLLEKKPIFISLAGVRGSGKSQFLASMVRELRALLPSRFFVHFDDSGTDANELLKAYEATLFSGGRATRPDSTVAAGDDSYDRIRFGTQVTGLPRTYIFTVHGRRGTGGTEHAPVSHTDLGAERTRDGLEVLCLSTCDGRNLDGDRESMPESQQLSRADVILFLYDPTQLTRFRELCRKVSDDPGLLGEPTAPQRQEALLEEVASGVRRYLGIDASEKHACTLIVIVGKTDIWAPVVRANLSREPFVSLADRDGVWAVDMDRVEKMSGEVRRMMLKLNPGFVALAEDFCQHVAYIPVSAAGEGPPSGNLDQVAGTSDRGPKWVTVPLLYAAAQWPIELIGGSRRGE